MRSNPSSIFARPATPPARGNGPLVTTDAFNAAGEVAAVVDPLGLVTAYAYGGAKTGQVRIT